MAWTYGADPANSPRDAVRLTIGDTDTTDQQLQDSEVDYYLGLYGDDAAAVLPAAIRCCEALGAKYARQVNTTNQGLSVGAAARMEHYRSLAATLRQQNATATDIFVGGVYRADSDALDENTSVFQPAFRVGLDDYNGPRDDGWDV